MDILDTEDILREEYQVEAADEAERRANEFIQFYRMTFYSKFKAAINKKLTDLDREPAMNSETALALQNQRVAYRAVLDLLASNEQRVSRYITEQQQA